MEKVGIMNLVSGFCDKAVEAELRNRLAASYVGNFSSEGKHSSDHGRN